VAPQSRKLAVPASIDRRGRRHGRARPRFLGRTTVGEVTVAWLRARVRVGPKKKRAEKEAETRQKTRKRKD